MADAFEIFVSLQANRGRSKIGDSAGAVGVFPGFEADLVAIRERIIVGLIGLVERAAHELREEATADSMRPKTGEWWANLPNRSSAPGESPARQSGNLINSIYGYFSDDLLSVTMGPTVDYAVYLHEGLKGPGSERPIMEGAASVVYERFEQRVRALVNGWGA